MFTYVTRGSVEQTRSIFLSSLVRSVLFVREEQ